METEALLGMYLTKSRAAGNKLERTEVARRIEHVFDELNLPWRRDGDSSWDIDADVGRVSAILNEDEDILTFSQVINQVKKADKRNGELYGALLRDNLNASGACFALMELEKGEPPYLVVMGRIAPMHLDPEQAALVLHSLFSLSAMFD